jgi:hypothetical protein
MLSLEKILEVVLPKENWRSFELEMTPVGFKRLGRELDSWDHSEPQVYVHVCTEGPLRNKVLRVGKAEAGINQRWLRATDGHCSTFLWASGDSDRYKCHNAIKYPKYLLFFASLYGLKTEIYVLSCERGDKGKGAARASEEALIAHFSPIWEHFKEYQKLDPCFPRLSGRNQDKDFHALVTTLGGAHAVIRSQRNEETAISKAIPDALNLGISVGGSIDEW